MVRATDNPSPVPWSLGRVESLENLAELALGNAHARIIYRHLYNGLRPQGSFYGDPASVQSGIDHRVHAVHRQTYYHLLQVNAIGPNEQWLPGVIRVQGNVSIPRLGEKDIHRVCNDVIEIELLVSTSLLRFKSFFRC